MIFILLPLVQATFVYRAITTQQNGPCSASTGILSVPKTLLGGSFTSFTIDGWFRRNSSTSTSNNLLWLVGPDINNYVYLFKNIVRSFHTAVTINTNLQVISCNAVNDCLNFTSTNLQGTQTSDLWVHVTVGMDFLNKQLHYNVQIHTDAMSYPGSYSETYQFSKTLTYTNTQDIVIKNQASNLFGLNGYCGQFNFLTYYGGYFSNKTRASQDVYAQMLIYIPFTETSGNAISNLLSTTQDTGTLMNGVTYSAGGTNYGFSFSKSQYVIFNNQRSQFGPRFTITVWAQVTAQNNFMNFFYRETATKSPILSILLTSDSSKFDVTVSALGIVADQHGEVRQSLNTWIPLVFSFYNNLNFFTNNNPPGMMLFDVLTNGFQNVGVRSYGLYQDSPSDVYYIGDFPAISTFTSGSFKYASVKIFTGANYGIIPSTDPQGCLYQVSDLFPACVACQKYLNAGASNNYQMCEESAQPGLISQSNIVVCPSQQNYNANICSELAEGCLRGTSASCAKCQNFYTLGSGSCTFTSTSICETGATDCKSNKFVQHSQIDIIETASLACKTGYYLSASLCLLCEESCLTCTNGTQCQTCPANKFLDTLCVITCPLWTDSDNRKCITKCENNQYQIESTKECVKQCTGALLAYGSKCESTCPDKTFQQGQSCVNCQNKCYKCSGQTNLQCQVCQFGYYLAGNVCENFCANSALYANQLKNECTATCDDGVIFNQQCLFICPEKFYADKDKKCVSVCPFGYYPNSQETDFTKLPLNEVVTLNGGLCTKCTAGCTSCFMDLAKNILCTSCDPDKFLVDTNCEDDCSSPFIFKDSINQKCLSSCPAPYYTSDNDCVYKCPNGTYNQSSFCKTTCDKGFYKETSNNECEKCDDRCTECFGGGENFCSKCQIGYYLYDPICLQVCPSDKQMKNIDDQTCYSVCPSGTLTLAELKECHKTCPSQYITDGDKCTSQCSAGTFSVGATCQTCDSRCTLCSDATNTKCSKCASGVYLDGTTCSSSCAVNPTYYKSIYGYLCVKTCPSTMYIVEDLLECVIQCPATYSRLNQNCLQTCPIGMFSNNFLCNKCPPECISCTAYAVCTKCQTSFYQQGNQCLHYCQNNYFQDPTTFQCIATCTLLVDSDGLGNKSCVKSCPVVKYLYQNTCLYQCPDGFYQQTSLKTCNKCALECETCTGNTNQDCIICSSGYELIDGYCTGQCPIGSFLNVVSCDTCAFRCLTCESTQYGCLTCRGDRQFLPAENILCLCRDGYFDDRTNDLCQPCNPPCINCSASKTCTSCLFNLSPPDCICKRTPPITSNFCITCLLAFSSNINFSYDFSQIVVVFTYDIMTQSDEAYFFSTNNCASWFLNDNFGDNAVCMQSSRNFLIQLGTNPTIQPGDKINMKPNVFTDKSSQLCQNTFITQFENMALSAPGMVQPQVLLKYPQVAISTCMDLNIEVIQEIGNAGRSLNYTSWTASPSTADIDKILKKATKFFTIPGMTLEANTQYTFTVAYRNFLGNSASQSFQIQTKDSSSTTLTLDVLSTDNFYANIDNKVPFSIHDYTCDTVIQETSSVFEVILRVVSLSSGTQIKNYTLSVQPSNRLISYFTIESGTLLPSTSYTFNISTGSIFDSKTINIGSNQLVAGFLTQDRIVTNSNFTINVTAKDTDVAENISTIGIQYIWSCKNLHLNIQCQTTNKNLLTLPQTQNITVGNLSSGYVYEFTCQVSKGSRVSNIVQQIIITDLNITDQIYNIDVTGKLQIILHDNIVYSLAVKQYYLVILSQYEILHIQFIQRPILRLNLYTYMSGLQNATDVNVIIGGSMVRYNFYVTPALSISKISILPTIGFSLETEFNISVTYNVTNTTQFQYYVYADNQSLQYDLSNFSNKNGFLIQDWTNNTNLTTKLPSSKYILVRVNDGTLYGMGYIQTSVTPSSQQVSVKNSVSYISSHKITTVYDAYLSLLELHFVNRQICIYNCWNRGDCINSVCVCDASYYFFSDCSGVQGDYNLWSTTGSKIFSLLQNSTTTEITKNAFTILFQQSQFQGIADLASSNIQSIVDQLSSSLQVSQQKTGIVQQGSQTINYQTPFRMISFLASLNTLAYTNSSTVDQIKSINSQILPHLNTLLDLTQSSLLISESVNYTTSFMNISISKKLKNTSRLLQHTRLLQENTTTQINIYMSSNIFRLTNDFPYPNHTQPLIYSSSDQNNSFSRIVNILPEKKITNIDTKKHNFICILSKDNGTIFGYKDCTQTTTVEPILCQCTAGYATVVDDIQYFYRPFYFTTDYVLNWYFVVCATLGYGIILLIIGIIGWRKDSVDWELVRPVSEGFAIKKEKMKVVSQLRKIPKASQVAPSISSQDTPKISSISEEKLQDVEELEGAMSDVFHSSSDIRRCHYENCILGIIFKFRKSLSRGQRLFIVLGRSYILMGLIGFVVNMQIIQIPEMIIYMSSISFILRVINPICRQLNKKAKTSKQCQYRCLSIGTVFVQMAVGGILSGIAYLTVYSRLIVYWMIAAGGLLLVDLLVIDFVLQLIKLLFDYLVFRNRTAKKEEQQRMIQEKTQMEKLYGQKGYNSIQEIVL